MPKPANNWYEIRNSADGETEIAIYDEIGGWGITAKAFRDSLARLGDTENIHLRIHSPGGSITEGNAIYNALKERKGAVRVSIDGIAASMATVVAMAGAPVSMAKNALFMIHNPFVCAMGDAEEMRKMADVMDKMKASIVTAYADKTKLSDKKLSDMMDEETWLTAQEAKDFGFIDSIHDETKDDDAKDFDLSRFKNSATFLSKLKQAGGASASGAGGNAPAAVTLRDLEIAVTNSTNQTQQANSQQTKIMNEQEKAALEAKNKQAIADGVKAALAEKNKLTNEIRDAVKAIAKRDKKDFSDLADEILAKDDATVDQFYRAVATSDKFKSTAAIVGSGIEVTEPMDRFKGTPGFAFVNSEAGRALIGAWSKSRHTFSLAVEVPEFRNAQTSSGLTSIEYVPGVSALGVRRLTVKDLIAGGATNQTTIRYRRESAFQNDAAAVLETGALANLTVTVVEADAPVKDIGGYIEMSENLMADYLAVTSFINQRVPYMVDRTVEDQLLNGSGSGANITGLLQTSGIQTQALAADTRPDAIRKAITKVRFVPNAVQANAQGGYTPDAIVMNPTDWETIRLLKDNAGQYFGGGPFTGAYGNGPFVRIETLWGLPVIETPAITAGTALVGAFKECAMYFQRQGLTMEMTNSNGTNFIQRIVTLRAAERLALTVPQPNGFCQVTGL